MNLAIEYIMRAKPNQLKLPCSLFLNGLFDKNCLVITIQNCYGQPQQLLVKHWYLNKISKDKILPPMEEFIINRTELFTSPFVVMDDFNILDYKCVPYIERGKQNSDEPYAGIQERQYQECIDCFFNTKINEISRKNWLWNNFFTAFLPETRAACVAISPDYQRSTICDMCPIVWKGWCMWAKQMMCDNSKSQFATELIYSKIFEEKIASNERYQEAIREKEQFNMKEYLWTYLPPPPAPPPTNPSWTQYLPSTSIYAKKVPQFISIDVNVDSQITSIANDLWTETTDN